MAVIEFGHLSTEERLDLIEQLWDSLTPDAVPVTPSHQAEIERRLATLDSDIEQGLDADDVLADLRRRHG